MPKHKAPAERSHVMEREARDDEQPAAAVDPEVAAYPHELPRHVHKAGGDYRAVTTPDECEAAFADGYKLLPPAPTK